MQTLYELYLQNPFWIWLGVGAVFLALDLASGAGKLIWAGVVAVGLAFLNLAKVRLGAPVEMAIFLIGSVTGVGLSLWLDHRIKTPVVKSARTMNPPIGPPTEELVATKAPSHDRTGRLIGRIGRTTGEFANGVGRVFIDDTEWSAEIDSGDGLLPSDTPVRVVGVTGGVRLKVHGLMN